MCDYTSSDALRALCGTFIERADPERIRVSPDNCSVNQAESFDCPQATDSGEFFGSDQKALFSSLAEAFILGLVLDSTRDLGTDWLLHRLHAILIGQQPLKAGEIEMLRADIGKRVEISNLSSMEKRLLASGVDAVLLSLRPSFPPLPRARPAGTDTGYAKR